MWVHNQGELLVLGPKVYNPQENASAKEIRDERLSYS